MTDSPQSPGSSTPGEPAGPPPQPSYGTPGGGAQAYGTPPPPPPYGDPTAQGAPPAYGTPPAAPPVYGTTTPGTLGASDQRMWAIFAHVGGIFFSFIPALVIWLIYKDRDDYVRDQSAEALNWQITLIIAYAVSGLLVLVLIGFFLLFAIGIASLVLGIMAAVAANRGERYRYPVNLRLVK